MENYHRKWIVTVLLKLSWCILLIDCGFTVMLKDWGKMPEVHEIWFILSLSALAQARIFCFTRIGNLRVALQDIVKRYECTFYHRGHPCVISINRPTLGHLDTEKWPNGPKLPHIKNSQPEHGSLRRALSVRNQTPALDDKSKHSYAPRIQINIEAKVNTTKH